MDAQSGVKVVRLVVRPVTWSESVSHANAWQVVTHYCYSQADWLTLSLSYTSPLPSTANLPLPHNSNMHIMHCVHEKNGPLSMFKNLQN